MPRPKKLKFKINDKVTINGVKFQVVKVRNGNMMVRPIGGYDMEGDVMVLRQPVVDKKTKESLSFDHDIDFTMEVEE